MGISEKIDSLIQTARFETPISYNDFMKKGIENLIKSEWNKAIELAEGKCHATGAYREDIEMSIECAEAVNDLKVK